VAVYKPHGLLVHRSEIDRHETRFVVQQLRDQLKQKVYPVHRLDKPTAGVLLFAFDPETASTLSTQFQTRKVEKQYLALVRGFMPDSGDIDHAYTPRFDARDAATHDRSKKLEALTRYECLQQFELDHPVGRYETARYSLVRLRPLTGRKHQLRRHMKHVFHPIVGDTSYGDGRHNRFFRQQLKCERLMLCATGLKVMHPVLGTPLEIKADPDDGFKGVINLLQTFPESMLLS